MLPLVVVWRHRVVRPSRPRSHPACLPSWARLQLPGGTFVAYDDYVELMQRCWVDAPEERPTFEQVRASGVLFPSMHQCVQNLQFCCTLELRLRQAACTHACVCLLYRSLPVSVPALHCRSLPTCA